MEMIIRDECPDRRWGLDYCIGLIPEDRFPPGLKKAFEQRKRAGKAFCNANGGCAAFDQRPMPQVLQEYAVNDVEFLPILFDYLCKDRGLCDYKSDMRFVEKLSKWAVDKATETNWRGNTPWSGRGLRALTDRWQ